MRALTESAGTVISNKVDHFYREHLTFQLLHTEDDILMINFNLSFTY